MHKSRKAFRMTQFVLLFGTFLSYSACGYRLRSSVSKLPYEMQSIGIPTFKNLSSMPGIEQLVTRAILKEFSLRTRSHIDSSNSGVDAVILGEILGVTSTPVTFGTQKNSSQTLGTAFLVTVQVSAKLIRIHDSAVLWQNDDFVFRERYILNANVKDFFSEENPAFERMANSFAASFAGSILNRSTP
jgi:hypothetical protein